jgi:hypothetical protein
MAIDISTLTDYAWSDIAKAAKTAMVKAALGGSDLTINDRRIGRISIKEAKLLYELATDMVALEDSTSPDGLALVRYGEKV